MRCARAVRPTRFRSTSRRVVARQPILHCRCVEPILLVPSIPKKTRFTKERKFLFPKTLAFVAECFPNARRRRPSGNCVTEEDECGKVSFFGRTGALPRRNGGRFRFPTGSPDLPIAGCRIGGRAGHVRVRGRGALVAFRAFWTAFGRSCPILANQIGGPFRPVRSCPSEPMRRSG